jgi:two-component system LytT family response regulator
MRVLIADDEPLARRGIRQLLRSHPDVTVVGEARHGEEAARMLKTLTPDLIFLDVQMPEMNGFEVLESLGTAHELPAVIFVTAYDEYAVKAFEAHALDYLVKPVHEDRFHDSLSRVRDRMRSKEAASLSHRLAQLLAAQSLRPMVVDDDPKVRALVVASESGDVMIPVDDIDWIEADDYYAAVHAHGRRHLLRESLQSLEQRLDTERFVRVHRSAMVNLSRVREVKSHLTQSVVVLQNGTRVPLSRRRRPQVEQALRRFAR